jgi:hypothetical protein
MRYSIGEENKADFSDLKHAGSWAYEVMEMLVDDSGIRSLDWTSPLQATDTLVKDSALLPFTRIREIFERQMRDTYEPRAKEEHTLDITFRVNRVSLELQRVVEQDSIENGLFVPVWNFYGTVVRRWRELDKPERAASDAVTQEDILQYGRGYDEPLVLLSVNAIDGSVIDIDMGF